MLNLRPLLHGAKRANVIEVDMTNTAQAKWADGVSRGDGMSGLLGPVRVLGARMEAH
jgi:hypothetical protein